VVTVHEGPIPALERIDALSDGETRFGDLDAAGNFWLVVGAMAVFAISLFRAAWWRRWL
jgi:hypothetical protein